MYSHLLKCANMHDTVVFYLENNRNSSECKHKWVKKLN